MCCPLLSPPPPLSLLLSSFLLSLLSSNLLSVSDPSPLPRLTVATLCLRPGLNIFSSPRSAPAPACRPRPGLLSFCLAAARARCRSSPANRPLSASSNCQSVSLGRAPPRSTRVSALPAPLPATSRGSAGTTVVLVLVLVAVVVVTVVVVEVWRSFCLCSARACCLCSSFDPARLPTLDCGRTR